MQLRSAAARSSLVALLLTLVVPATAAVASHVEVRDTAAACADAPEDGFKDTGTQGSAQEEAVDCISWYEITSGTSASTYEPGAPIRRAQMARMVAESMRQSLGRFVEPGDGVDHFSDDDSSPFEQDIDFVAEYDVVQGKDGRYNPAGFVTRAQMATFLVNQLEAIGVSVPTPSQDYFDDDNESPHENNINRLAELGLASGRTDRGYEPNRPVTRGQMALFISRDLGLLVEAQFMVTPDEQVDPAQDGAHTNAAVATISRPANSFATSQDDEEHGAERFWYDDNDVFQGPDGGTITLAEFEGLLTGPVGDTAGDVVDVTYAHAEADESTFQVVTDNVPPATDATAFAGDHDGDGDRSDVIVAWTASEQPNVLYDVFRDDGSLLTGDTEVASDVSGTSVLLTDEPDGTWSYYVRATSPTTGESSTDAQTNDVTVPAPAGTEGRPVSQQAVQNADGVPGDADEGDVWRFAFDQPLGEIEEGDSLTVVEGLDGTKDAGEAQETVTHAPPPVPGFPAEEGDAIFSLNSESVTVNGISYGPGQVLSVELLAPLMKDADGDGTEETPVRYPLTVQYSTGLTDRDGQPVDWAGSPDRTIEADTTSPFMVDADGDLNGTGPDRIMVTYSEDVVCDGTATEAAQFEYDRDTSVSGDEVQARDITCDGSKTVVLEFPDGVFVPDSPRDQVRYTEASESAAIEDNVGNNATSPDDEEVDG